MNANEREGLQENKSLANLAVSIRVNSRSFAGNNIHPYRQAHAR